MLGAVSSFFLLNHALIPENIGWRLAFFVGPVLGLVIIFIRRHIPESPRWMVTHGQGDEAFTLGRDRLHPVLGPARTNTNLLGKHRSRPSLTESP
jgi:MFS family permease